MKPEVVVARADTPDGWRKLTRTFGAAHGRPVIKPREPMVAIWGRINRDRNGYPAYCRLDDTECIEAARREKLIEARQAAG